MLILICVCFRTKIEFLKGVGPRAALLNTELSIFNFDLLTFFHFVTLIVLKYTDSQIKNFDIDFQLIGTVKEFQ